MKRKGGKRSGIENEPLRGEWTKEDQAFAKGEESKEDVEVFVSLVGKSWQGKSQDADGKGGEGSAGAVAGVASRDFHKGPDCWGLSAGP